LQIARKFSDREGEAAALGSLGEAYRLRGKFDKAIETLLASLNIAQDINLSGYRSSVLNSLGNAYFSKAQLNEQRANSANFRSAETKADDFIKEATSDYKKALNYFNNSLELTRTQNDSSGQMRTLLNLIQLYYRPKDSELPDSAKEAEQKVQEALVLLEMLPNSQIEFLHQLI
jgi:tetratricopeptide (TPR) repeat protein